MVKAQDPQAVTALKAHKCLQRNLLYPLNVAPLPCVGNGGWKEILPIIQTHYTNHILSCGSRV